MGAAVVTKVDRPATSGDFWGGPGGAKTAKNPPARMVCHFVLLGIILVAKLRLGILPPGVKGGVNEGLNLDFVVD